MRNGYALLSAFAVLAVAIVLLSCAGTASAEDASNDFILEYHVGNGTDEIYQVQAESAGSSYDFTVFPYTPESKGYTFLGWYLVDSDSAGLYHAGDTVTVSTDDAWSECGWYRVLYGIWTDSESSYGSVIYGATRTFTVGDTVNAVSLAGWKGTFVSVTGSIPGITLGHSTSSYYTYATGTGTFTTAGTYTVKLTTSESYTTATIIVQEASGSTEEIAPTSIHIYSSMSESFSYERGRTAWVMAYVEPQDATNSNIVWSVNDASMASVAVTEGPSGAGTIKNRCSAGISLLKAGSVTVTATSAADSSLTASYTIKVTEYMFDIFYDFGNGEWDGRVTYHDTLYESSTADIKYTVLKFEPTLEGSVFKGWDTSSSASTVRYTGGSTVTVTHDDGLELYAVWQKTGYVISLTASPSSYGTVTGAGTYSPGETVTIKAVPSATHVFEGWSDGNTDATRTFTATEDVSLAARFDLIPYTVVFHANGGSGTMENQIFRYGSWQALTANSFTRTGYVFSGWAESPNGSVADKDGAMLIMRYDEPRTIDLYAVWTPQHTVTFINEQGATKWTRTVTEGTSVKKPSSSTSYMYYADEDRTIAYMFRAVYADETVYIKYTSGTTYSVVFQLTEGYRDILCTQNIASGGTAARLQDPDTGTYSYWSDSSCTEPYTFGPVRATTSVFVSLTVKDSYTVSFETNGGSSVASQTVYDGGRVKQPSDPARDGYTFKGWYSDSKLTTLYDFTTMVSGSFTLYAGWTEDGSGTVPGDDGKDAFTVTFETGGGSTVASQRVPSGGLVTRTADPTRSGYSFAGWYSDAKLTTLYDYSSAVTGDLTLYAKWTAAGAAVHTVRYIATDGTVIQTAQVADGETAPRLDDPDGGTYSYYTKGLVMKYRFAPVTEDTDIYAVVEDIVADGHTATELASLALIGIGALATLIAWSVSPKYAVAGILAAILGVSEYLGYTGILGLIGGLL